MSSKDILNLEPKAVWKNFHSITQIPRPSGKKEEIGKFLVDFGKSLGLEAMQDEIGNVLVRKPATSGMENRKSVILQAHMDMVPQKNSDVKHDFEKDPIQTIVDGEWVRANNTTLGADNGIGVAAAMAVGINRHSASGYRNVYYCRRRNRDVWSIRFATDFLQGDILINMDSEDEGELYVVCRRPGCQYYFSIQRGGNAS